MFSLEKTLAKLRNVNPLSENHGKDIESGGSITAEVTTSNEKLDELCKGLRIALCRAPVSGDQGSLLQSKVPDELTAIRFPALATTWSEVYPGYEVHISNGLGLEDPIVLVDATIKNISWKLLEGGSVAWKFTIIAHPDTEDAGLLWHLQKREVELTLKPPTAIATETDDNLGDGIVDGSQLPPGGEGDTLEQQEAAAEAERLKTLGKKKAA